MWNGLPPVSVGVFLERLQNHSHDRHYGFNDTKLQCCLKRRGKIAFFKRLPLENTTQQWFFSTADLKKWHLFAEAQESDGVAFALQATSSSRPTWPGEKLENLIPALLKIKLEKNESKKRREKSQEEEKGKEKRLTWWVCREFPPWCCFPRRCIHGRDRENCRWRKLQEEKSLQISLHCKNGYIWWSSSPS